jgi:phosphatidylglycerophosphatase A
VIARPTVRFLSAHPAHAIALGFGAGLAPVAPGTAGTLAAFPLFIALSAWLGPLEMLVLAALLFALGVWACGRTGAAMGIPDHGCMVWDEVVAFFVILVFTPSSWGWQLFAFLAFRVFDVLKPPPIREIDRHWKGGFGVMFDDVVAAFYTLLLIAIAKRSLDAWL